MAKKTTLIIAGISGGIAIILGALGAHALSVRLTPDQLASFKTGTTYHIFHSIVLLLIGLSGDKIDRKASGVLTTLFSLGIVLFSGSIYILSTKDLLGTQALSFIWPVTPIGGLTFISGWLMIAIYAIQNRFK